MTEEGYRRLLKEGAGYFNDKYPEDRVMLGKRLSFECFCLFYQD